VFLNPARSFLDLVGLIFMDIPTRSEKDLAGNPTKYIRN
jgi:hypothetical protein